MTRAVAVLLLCCIASPAVFAQSSDPDQLSDKERLGWRLYEQSCSICHTKPNLVCTENWIRLDARQRLGNPAT